jgi:raffinose/stachyose/melibiose transport system substrate-binding protein
MLPSVVSLNEVMETYPDAPLTVNPLMTETDGKIYAVPVRPIWEGLLCNTDLFEQHGVELPTTWEQLKTAVAKFKEAGVVPISVALNETPHYITEVAILASGPASEYAARPTSAGELPNSWVKGMELIRELYQMGAFPEQTSEMSEEDSDDMFLAKQAAMTISGTWLANGIPEEAWNSTVVIPFPAYRADADSKAVVGGITMGFYLTRSAWEDEAKRAPAVSLLEYLTRPEAAAKLGVFYEGRLLESAQQMVGSASGLYSPISDNMYYDARVFWYENVLSMAQGQADPRQVMTQVIEQGAFTKTDDEVVGD